MIAALCTTVAFPATFLLAGSLGMTWLISRGATYIRDLQYPPPQHWWENPRVYVVTIFSVGSVLGFIAILLATRVDFLVSRLSTEQRRSLAQQVNPGRQSTVSIPAYEKEVPIEFTDDPQPQNLTAISPRSYYNQ